MSRYRVNANLVWNVEGNNYKEAEARATELLLGLVKLSGMKLKTISMNRLRDRPKVKKLGELSPEEVLPFAGPDKKEYHIGGQVYNVKMNSPRYKLFAKDRKCVVCGVEGVRMVLELPPGSQNPHFNLYAVEDNEYILMTKDHKVPRASGGKDSSDNYQTMCVVCNGIKGCADLSIDDVRLLREMYNHYRDKMTPSRIHKIIAAEKKGRFAVKASRRKSADN